MSKITPLIGATAILLGLAACGGCSTTKKPHAATHGNAGVANDTAQTDATPSPTPLSDQDVVATAPTASPTPAATIPYGTPVPNKPGFVTSPYSANGYVDVRGFPPGTEVKDPYTGKIFLVP